MRSRRTSRISKNDWGCAESTRAVARQEQRPDRNIFRKLAQPVSFVLSSAKESANGRPNSLSPLDCLALGTHRSLAGTPVFPID